MTVIKRPDFLQGQILRDGLGNVTKPVGAVIAILVILWCCALAVTAFKVPNAIRSFVVGRKRMGRWCKRSTTMVLLPWNIAVPLRGPSSASTDMAWLIAACKGYASSARSSSVR